MGTLLGISQRLATMQTAPRIQTGMKNKCPPRRGCNSEHSPCAMRYQKSNSSMKTPLAMKHPTAAHDWKQSLSNIHIHPPSKPAISSVATKALTPTLLKMMDIISAF
jgi:hypothetical protein